MALASLLTGLSRSLITTWGLFRHHWVVLKLLIAVGATIVLRPHTFVLHSSVALVLLLVATALAVYKPRGMTRYGWRKQQELRSGSSS